MNSNTYSRTNLRTLLVGLGAIACIAGGSAGASDHTGDGLDRDSEATNRRSAGAEPGAARAALATANDGTARMEPVVYVPPSRGRARNTAAGGTRTVARKGKGTSVAVLAPSDHVALTTREQPTLYWYVSEDTNVRIDLTVVDEESIDPLIEVTLASPVTRGIHALDLAERGLRLEPGKTYEWHVAVVPDAKRRSNDTFAQGYIARAPTPPDLLTGQVSPTRYAESGIWYDAMADLMSAIEADPSDPALQAQRALWLEQAGLKEVAGFAASTTSGGAR